MFGITAVFLSLPLPGQIYLKLERQKREVWSRPNFNRGQIVGSISNSLTLFFKTTCFLDLAGSSFHFVYLINSRHMLKFTSKDQSPFEYLQPNRVYINGEDKPWYVSIINLNNLVISIRTNWKLMNITWRQSRNTCSLFSLCDFELIFWAFSVVLCILHEIMKQCCNNDMDRPSFCIFPTKHGPQMEQKQTRVFNNRALWTYHIMQIWEETVANFCILPVWISIAQKCFSIL